MVTGTGLHTCRSAPDGPSGEQATFCRYGEALAGELL